MELFNFEPDEFRVLEDIDFDETIQRPEKIRFYTLSEQTSDAYEKLLPKGRTTRYQKDLIRKDIDQIQALYEKYVLALPEDYALREPEYGRSFSWVHPVYPGNDRKPYNWATSWTPLFENVRQPGHYPRMITALPRPYVDQPSGAQYDLRARTKFVSSEGTDPLLALPVYEATRTQVHEDKTIDILQVPIEGSQDVVHFTGYFLDKRPLELPNPLPDHPFLKGNEPTFIESTAPLKDVIPSLDAILTHGVPVTKDPYGEAAPFLKIYDIKLEDIPWSSWKSKFPPAEVISITAQAAPIEFPKPSQLAPPKKVIDAYGSEYSPGMSVRLWLMRQIDGGSLIPSLLLSESIGNGSIESIPGVDIAPASYPATTLNECGLEGKTFPDFNTTGILRRTIDGSKITYQCVPLEFIKQERGRLGYLGRKPWSDSTSEDIKKAHIKRLVEVLPIPEMREKKLPTIKTPGRPDSLLHKEVIAIQSDPQRYVEDKIKDIQDVLKEATLTKNVYTDTNGSFVFCSHSMALLAGDLAKDRRKYYDTWAAIADGRRVCKFCGQVINDDVYVEGDQYDQDGFKIVEADTLEEGPTFAGAAIKDFTTGLTKLRPYFVMESPHDETVYLLLSLIQVLPVADALEPLLKLGRAFSNSPQFEKYKGDQKTRLQGAVGLATTALLLQMHIPRLIPRRSFGPRPLVLSGYPRDAVSPGEITIVDSLIGVLRKTFEAFPTSFGGPSKQLIRGILTRPGEIRTIVVNLLSAKSPLMTTPLVSGLMTKAKSFFVDVQEPEQPKSLIPVMKPPANLDVIRSYAECPTNRPIWTSGRVAPIMQPAVPLVREIVRTGKPSAIVVPSVSDRVVPEPTTEAQARTMLGKESKAVKVSTGYRTNLLLASRIADMFQTPIPVRGVDPNQSEAKLRDISKGLVYSAADTVAKRNAVVEKRTKDITLYTLLADYKEERTQLNKLRASERMKVIDQLRQKSDTERAIIGDLLQIGLAPYLITNRDREMFATEAQQLQAELYRDELELEEVDAEAGVGLPRDQHDDGEEDELIGVDHGDYGDRAALPIEREYRDAAVIDDPSRSI